MSTIKKAYSYLRFSTPEQAMGRSEGRQLEAAKRYADSQGIELDSSTMLADRGLSGYHGTHRKKGALGRFLMMVEAGQVAPGSILIVENPDRLSREGVYNTIKNIFINLVEHDVVVHFLTTGISIDKDAFGDWRVNYLNGELTRGQAESKRKSELAKDAWRQKQKDARERGLKVTGSCKAWLIPVYEDPTAKIKVILDWELRPGADKTIIQIFKWKRDGLGYGSITQNLNDPKQGWWKPPVKKGGGRPNKDGTPAAVQETTGWRISFVRKILFDRAVLGEYQPYREVNGKRVPDGDVILDYYPKIVAPGLFGQIQELLKANQNKGGRTARAANLLTHLVKCAYCRGPMNLEDKGSRGGTSSLVCLKGINAAGCKRFKMKYPEVEGLVLTNLPNLKPEDVLPNQDEQAELCRRLHEKIAGDKAQIDKLESEIRNLGDKLASTNDPRVQTRIEQWIIGREENKAALELDMIGAKAELQKAETNRKTFAVWQRSLTTLTAALQDPDPAVRFEMRVKTHRHLANLIERIEVFTDGHGDKEAYLEPLWDRYTEAFPRLRRDEAKLKQVGAFIDWLVSRMMSKEGRFIRVFFKGGSRGVDLVPDGSLAHGLQWDPKPGTNGVLRDGWNVKGTELDGLWDEFNGTKRSDKKAHLKRKREQKEAYESVQVFAV
jgi:DNA invertase Pin-like site-specific DNA recombinase